jgi:hypothetical protein
MRYLAQLTNPVLPPSIGQGGVEKGGPAIGMFITNVIGGMFIVAFFVALLYLITGGFHWITSGGDKANLESARNKIIHAIVGLIVVASIWAVMTVVGQFVGLDFTNLPIPTIR